MSLINDICYKAAEASNIFEENNSDLKREYLIRNIILFNDIVRKTNESYGTFGTGYPFYSLKGDITGNLPVIDEQFRYNKELIDALKKVNWTTWPCLSCLKQNGSKMPDLKQLCKPCKNIENSLKPRELLKRLPDVDMWMICKESNIDTVKETLVKLFKENDMYPSDIDPVRAIEDVHDIALSIKKQIMPSKLLPLDAHIIGYETLGSLIEQIPYILKQAKENDKVPYLPILPLSYRKTWQYDDTPYNFVHDYLSSFTEFNLDNDLKQILTDTRKEISTTYKDDQLYDWLIKTGPSCVKRRHKTPKLKNRFIERINLWKE